jgi:hypothetical protein
MADLRSVEAGSLLPTRPCVFVVSDEFRYTTLQKALPLLVVEIGDRDFETKEIGRRSGSDTGVVIHLLGRNPGERDIIDYLASALPPAIPVYDYTSGSQVLLESVLVGDSRRVSPLGLTNEDLRVEMSLEYWYMLEFSIASITN